MESPSQQPVAKAKARAKAKGKKRRKERSLEKLPVNALLEKAMFASSSIKLVPLPTLSIPEAKIQKPERLDFSMFEDLDGDDTHRSSTIGSSRLLMRRGMGMSVSDMSIGSSHLDASVSSDYSSVASRVSLRDLITDIERCELRHRPPPEYVIPLPDLSPVHLSWNHKIPKRSADDHRDPPVNILGCMHPVQLILAKADKRIRKQRQAQELKVVQCEKKIEEINQVIEWKMTRAERHAKLAALQQAQRQWLVVAHATKYLAALRMLFAKFKASHERWKVVLASAARISRCYHKWYRRLLATKLSGRVTTAFVGSRNIFRLYLSIWRKRQGIKKIKTFLSEYRNHHKMNVVVHRYLQAVRRVQCAIREFLLCKCAKMDALCRIWDRVEYGYIKRKLEQKRERMKGDAGLIKVKGSAKDSGGKRKAAKPAGGATIGGGPPSPSGPGAGFPSPAPGKDDDDASTNSAATSLLESKEHSQVLLEMKHQAKSWQRIDDRMETMIVQLRRAGVIQEEKEEDTIAKLVAPHAMKWRSLQQVVERTRHDFFNAQRSLIRERIRMDETFSERHALELLRGNAENIDRIVNNKFGSQTTALRFQPLRFFKTLDRRLIFEKIREAHTQLRTFHISIDHHWK